MAVPGRRINLSGELALACCCGLLVCLLPPVTGSYLRDVELIAPSPASFNTVHYYPSYVKGEDPVEEFNRRRLHVDTAMYARALPKRKRKAVPPRRSPKLASEHERHYLQIRQPSPGVPRYVRDDVELFDVEPGGRITSRGAAANRSKAPNGRRPRTVAPETAATHGPRRYEESDPQIFAYERADTPGRQQGTPGESKYFQDTVQLQQSPLELEFGHLFESNDGWEERYERQDHRNHRHQGKVNALRFAEVFGDGSHVASSRRGNDRHYVEQYERGSHDAGVFQKKVKWADKQGGFGEHYWDLNHIHSPLPQPPMASRRRSPRNGSVKSVPRRD